MRPLQQVLEIQSALELAGTSQADIARKLGKSHATISYVVHGKEKARGVKISDETIALIRAAINEAAGRDLFAGQDGTRAMEGEN